MKKIYPNYKNINIQLKCNNNQNDKQIETNLFFMIYMFTNGYIRNIFIPDRKLKGISLLINEY